MPRIIVTTDPPSPTSIRDTAVLLSESVHSVHLSTDHAAGQLIERLAWAITDAERAEGARRGGAASRDDSASAPAHESRSPQRRSAVAEPTTREALAA